MERDANSYHSQGLMRGLLALRTLGDRGQPVGLADLSRAMDLPKPSLLRLLAVMEREGFVSRFGQPPVYTLGPSVYTLAESLTPVELPQVTASTLKDLADELGFTSNLGVLQGQSVLHLDVAEPARALRIAAGGFLDHTYCTGLGKMLLSVLDLDLVGGHLPTREPYESFTDRTLTTRAQLDDELSRIRERGFSIDDQERNRGVRCMAVLVPIDHEITLSLSVSGPAGELPADDEARIHRRLRDAAKTVADLPRLGIALQNVRTRLAIS
ncbi:IclR family transcriptional regulator [Microbacterium saperdae]